MSKPVIVLVGFTVIAQETLFTPLVVALQKVGAEKMDELCISVAEKATTGLPVRYPV